MVINIFVKMEGGIKVIVIFIFSFLKNWLLYS